MDTLKFFMTFRKSFMRKQPQDIGGEIKGRPTGTEGILYETTITTIRNSN